MTTLVLIDKGGSVIFLAFTHFDHECQENSPHSPNPFLNKNQQPGSNVGALFFFCRQQSTPVTEKPCAPYFLFLSQYSFLAHGPFAGSTIQLIETTKNKGSIFIAI
jgi:hypothetical protein